MYKPSRLKFAKVLSILGVYSKLYRATDLLSRSFVSRSLSTV